MLSTMLTTSHALFHQILIQLFEMDSISHFKGIFKIAVKSLPRVTH